MAAANFACFSPVFILEPLLARHFSVREAVALGFIYAANGVGGTFASVYITRFGAPRRRIAAIWATLAGAGLGAVLLGISSSIWLATAVACVLWGAATYGNTLWLTEIQETVPAELLGRVMSLDWLVSLALTPLGTLAAGALASALGVRTTLVIGGSVAACAGLVVLLPKVREPDRRRIAETAETEAHR
jgi:predicted MFS family arabinose efflux permease